VDDAADLEHLPVLREQVAGLRYARIDGLAAKLQRPLALATGEAISVRAFHSMALQRQLDELLDHTSFDCVLAFSSPMAEYCFRSRHWTGAFRRMRKMMDLIDVDSAKWNDYAARSSGWRRLVYRREARLLAIYETRVAREFDHLFLVTEAERSALPPGVPVAKVIALPNGVDMEYFTPGQVPAEGAENVVFTGVMDYWPNVEGVRWFVHEVWPAVRKRHPQARFDIVGSRPDARVRELASGEGIRVTGFVPDVRDYVAASSLCVAPLRIARGVQNKVLEAMAMGRPVVCTSNALEGIPALPGRDVLVADDATAFAAAVCRVLESPDDAARMGIAARACVERHHRWEATLAPLDALLT
jgi:sugar transferase (PEP-CTERM/EpsH1 system associated)